MEKYGRSTLVFPCVLRVLCVKALQRALQRNAAPAAGNRAELGKREIEARAVVVAGRVMVAEALLQPRVGEMRAVGRVDRQARLQVALRLAPQRAVGAQPPEREQQRGIVRVLLQPPFGALDPLHRIAALALGVEGDEIAFPLGLERLLDDAVRLVAGAEGDEALRRRAGDAPVPAVAGGHLVPRLIQRASIERLALEILRERV